MEKINRNRNKLYIVSLILLCLLVGVILLIQLLDKSNKHWPTVGENEITILWNKQRETKGSIVVYLTFPVGLSIEELDVIINGVCILPLYDGVRKIYAPFNSFTYQVLLVEISNIVLSHDSIQQEIAVDVDNLYKRGLDSYYIELYDNGDGENVLYTGESVRRGII